MTVTKRMEDVTTLANAKAYQDTSEKFIFCLDLLELSLTDDGDPYCDGEVNLLEDRFEWLLANIDGKTTEQLRDIALRHEGNCNWISAAVYLRYAIEVYPAHLRWTAAGNVDVDRLETHLDKAIALHRAGPTEETKRQLARKSAPILARLNKD